MSGYNKSGGEILFGSETITISDQLSVNENTTNVSIGQFSSIQSLQAQTTSGAHNPGFTGNIVTNLSTLYKLIVRGDIIFTQHHKQLGIVNEITGVNQFSMINGSIASIPNSTELYICRNLIKTGLQYTEDSTPISEDTYLNLSGNCQSEIHVGDALFLSNGHVVGIVDTITDNTSIQVKYYKHSSFDIDSQNMPLAKNSFLYVNRINPLIQWMNLHHECSTNPASPGDQGVLGDELIVKVDSGSLGFPIGSRTIPIGGKDNDVALILAENSSKESCFYTIDGHFIGHSDIISDGSGIFFHQGIHHKLHHNDKLYHHNQYTGLQVSSGGYQGLETLEVGTDFDPKIVLKTGDKITNSSGEFLGYLSNISSVTYHLLHFNNKDTTKPVQVREESIVFGYAVNISEIHSQGVSTDITVGMRVSSSLDGGLFAFVKSVGNTNTTAKTKTIIIAGITASGTVTSFKPPSSESTDPTVTFTDGTTTVILNYILAKSNVTIANISTHGGLRHGLLRNQKLFVHRSPGAILVGQKGDMYTNGMFCSHDVRIRGVCTTGKGTITQNKNEIVITGDDGDGTSSLKLQANSNQIATIQVNSSDLLIELEDAKGMKINSNNNSTFSTTTNNGSEELTLRFEAKNIADEGDFQKASIDLCSSETIRHYIKDVPVIQSTREQFLVNISSESTSTVSGGFVVTGGVGIAKNLYCGQTINVNSITSGTLSSTTVSSATLTTHQFAKSDIYCLRKLVLTDTTDSTEPYIGALTVLGGMGVQKDISVGGEIGYMSDKNVKQHIYTIQNPLDKIKKISGVEFQWKESKQYSAGVIAQEIEEVLPVAVSQNKAGYKTVKYNCLIGLLIEGMKQQQTHFQQLQSTMKTLHTQLNQVTEQVTQIQNKLLQES